MDLPVRGKSYGNLLSGNKEEKANISGTLYRAIKDDEEYLEIRRRSNLTGIAVDLDKEGFSTIEVVKHDKKKLDKELIKEAISKNEYLNQILEGKRLNAAVDAMYKREVVTEEIIIKEGSIGTQLYISANGSYEITIKGQTVDKFNDNKVFGELAILYNEKRAATVKALTIGCIWVLDQDVYQKLRIKEEIEQQDKMIAFLEKIPKLNTVSKKILRKVTYLLKQECYAAGQVIIKEGDPGDKFYIISAGTVTVSKQLEGEIKTMTLGEFFGELALLNDEGRQATVTAHTPKVECFSLSRSEFVLHFGDVDDIKNISNVKTKSTGAMANQYQDVELNDLIIQSTLGIGGFGRVKLAQHKKQRDLVFAVKCIKKIDLKQEEEKDATNEIDLQMNCDSSFIVRIYKTLKNKEYLYFLMELCLGGDLFSLMQTQGGQRFNEPKAKFYVASVLEALAYLHQRDIVYRDLKPENLLLDPQGNLKLTDFGIAKKLWSAGRTYTFAGTPEYVAPEILLNRGHNKAVDYWALGILTFELLVGRSPFRTNDSTYLKTYNLILRGIEKIRFPDFIPIKAEKLIKQLCKAVPEERLGSQNGPQAIRDHKWFTGFVWEELQNGKMKAPLKRKVKSNTDTRYFEKF